MLEQKLVVNRLINLDLQNVAAPRYANGAFVKVPVQEYYIEESTGVGTKTSQVVQGSSPKAHRNFKWLPWLPGAISEVALVGKDVLTGPMSGCWLVTYRSGSNVPFAGHLGTDIASRTRTDAVNNAWNQFATDNPGRVIGGFNPFRHWHGDFPGRKNGEPAQPPKIFGLYTVDLQFYIIVAYPQADTPTIIRIAGIQRVDSVAPDRLRRVHEPGP